MKMTTSKTLLATLIMGLSAGAQAIELTDYIDPNSSYDDAYLTGRANLTDSDANERASHNVTLNGNYDYRFNTLPRTYSLDLDGSIQSVRNASKDEGENSTYNLDLSGTVDNYFNPANPKMFWFGQGSAGWNRSNVENAAGDTTTESTSAALTAGVGYGRIFNATPLAKVLRMEEELRKYGVLTGALSDDVYLEVAKIVDREDEYRSRHGTDEYKPFWVADMEAVFKRAGVLNGDQLGALGTLKINDILFEETISNRSHGWLVRGGASYKFNDIDSAFDKSSFSDPALLFEFQYAKPYGLRGQFINTARFEPADKISEISNNMSYTYEVSDRLDWINSWNIGFIDNSEANTESTINTLASTWAYEVNSDLDYDLGLTYTLNDDGTDDTSTTNVTAGLTYRLK